MGIREPHEHEERCGIIVRFDDLNGAIPDPTVNISFCRYGINVGLKVLPVRVGIMNGVGLQRVLPVAMFP